MFLSVKIIIIIGFALRLIISIWNGFFGPSPGADLDAAGLNSFAENVARTGEFEDFSIGYKPYTNTLGLIYHWTFSHIFIGSLLSCIFWLWSAFLFGSSLKILPVGASLQKRAMWVYAILPSSVMFTSVTLREPYQLFFVTVSIFSVLKIYIEKKNHHWITLFIGVLGAGILHGALLAFGIIMIAGAILLLKIRGTRKFPWLGILVISVISLPILIFIFSIFGEFSYNLDDGLYKAVEAYQLGGLGVDARTHYKTDVSITGFGSFLLFIPVSLFQYLFEPMPWRISTASDALLLMENILRYWLIWRCVKSYNRLTNSNRAVWIYIFLAYLILETIWSLGTVNWGTAARHHIPSMSLLLLASFAVPEYKFIKYKK